jgi:uncharacterized membrane protein
MANTISFGDNIDANKNTNNNVKQKVVGGNNALVIISLLVALIAVAFSVYMYIQKNSSIENANVDLVKQQQLAAEESKRYMDKLKGVLLVEGDETPVIAKVADAEKLKLSNPEFYKNVQKDDVVMIFSYRIIIYRESENKIINVAPIINTKTLQDQAQSSSKATSTK